MNINAGSISRLLITLILACGPVAPGDEPATTSGNAETGAPATTDAPTTDAPPTTGVGPGSTIGGSTGAGETTSGPVVGTTSGSTSGAGDDTCGFICEGETLSDSCGLNADGPGDGLEWRCTLCDVFQQDCPEGFKCAAKAEGGGSSWNTTTCAPVTGDGAPGNTCTAEDGVNGVDDCRKGAMCWDVDKETHKGICVELCTGSEAAPMCSNESAFDCAVVNEGVLNLCLPRCDPLLQDCAGDDLCIPVVDAFICVHDASGEGGQTFGACEFTNACDAGLLCLNPSAAVECDPNAGGCCLPMCDLSDMDAVCPGEGQSCMPLFGDGLAPPEFVNVGICTLPE